MKPELDRLLSGSRGEQSSNVCEKMSESGVAGLDFYLCELGTLGGKEGRKPGREPDDQEKLVDQREELDLAGDLWAVVGAEEQLPVRRGPPAVLLAKVIFARSQDEAQRGALELLGRVTKLGRKSLIDGDNASRRSDLDHTRSSWGAVVMSSLE